MTDAEEEETANRKKQTTRTKATRSREIDVSFRRISKTAIFDYSAWKKNNYHTRFTVLRWLMIHITLPNIGVYENRPGINLIFVHPS